MMGAHHAACGAAAWVALTATSHLIPALGWMPQQAGAVALGAIVCAGAALLPDADHPSATIAHSVPVVGKVVTTAIAGAAGGHRHGTHSGISAIAVTALAVLFAVLGWADTSRGSVYIIGAGIVAAILLAFATKVLKIVRSWGVAWLSGIAIAGLVTWLVPSQWAWLPAAVAVGWVVHMMGDFLTTGGLPLAWPLKPKPPQSWADTPILGRLWTRGGYFALPILGNAGSWREWLLAIPIWGYALYGMAVSTASILPFVTLPS